MHLILYHPAEDRRALKQPRSPQDIHSMFPKHFSPPVGETRSWITASKGVKKMAKLGFYQRQVKKLYCEPLSHEHACPRQNESKALQDLASKKSYCKNYNISIHGSNCNLLGAIFSRVRA